MRFPSTRRTKARSTRSNSIEAGSRPRAFASAFTLLLPFLLGFGHASARTFGEFADDYGVPAAVAVLGVSVATAQALAPETYSWRNNTISDLGAQGYDRGWIMRAGFVGFGTMVAGTAAHRLAVDGGDWPKTAPLLVYGAAVALTGVSSTAPFESGAPYSRAEAARHSLYANVAGIALSASMLGSMLTRDDTRDRTADLAALAFVSGTSAMFMRQPERQGLWQRVLWTGGLTWLAVSCRFD